ncbi:MAG TPA: hypothetical protein VGH27_34435 [Streptosporangiaceae bacterium]|jgi:hypothetical protein
MFNVYDQLLEEDPITPQVRSAVFTDLAKLPGVHSIGQVTDPLGRTGYGIALSAASSTASSPAAPVSGARPALPACPKGSRMLSSVKKICMLTAAQARAAGGPSPNGKPVLVTLGPVAYLPAGQVSSYTAVVSAGWTNTAPPLPPRSEQFSVVKDGKG